MSLILLDLAYITVKSISYLGYYTYQGLSAGISHGYDYFYNYSNGNRSKNNVLMIKNKDDLEMDNDSDGDSDSFIVIDGKSEYFVKQNKEKFELQELKDCLNNLKEKLD